MILSIMNIDLDRIVGNSVLLRNRKFDSNGREQARTATGSAYVIRCNKKETCKENAKMRRRESADTINATNAEAISYNKRDLQNESKLSKGWLSDNRADKTEEEI